MRTKSDHFDQRCLTLSMIAATANQKDRRLCERDGSPPGEQFTLTLHSYRNRIKYTLI